LALLTSRTAEQKAQDAWVKRFAQFEVAEQETIAEVIKSMEGANLTTGAGAKPNAEAKNQLDAKGQQMVTKLQQAKAGPDFDREYIQGQIDGHKQLLVIQETYLQSGKMREQVNAAKLAVARSKSTSPCSILSTAN